MVQVTPGVLTNKEIIDIVNTFDGSQERQNIIDNLKYYKGNNPHITERSVPDDSGPDNRIPVSYARRIINIVIGYMFKPGLVQYTSENEKYLELLNEVFKENNEPLRTEQAGKQTSIQGIGYEYHYIDPRGPRFVKLSAAEVIPIYDWSVDPELWAFIRYYKKNDSYIINLVDDKAITEYSWKKEASGLTFISTTPHFYNEVPLVVYRNNEDLIGDFDPIEPLIDAYDTLISDSMNEFDRFAWAYLILKGMSLNPENAEKIKRMRMFENLDDEQGVSFLTKTIDTAFIQFMTETIRQEIHRQSGIPNLDDYTFGGAASGATLGKFIYLMELFTDPKESYFTEGLYKRIRLITNVLKFLSKPVGEPEEITVIMNRNKPDASLEQAQIFSLYDGRVSRKTLLENFADFVKDAQKELDQLKEEQGQIYDAGLIAEYQDGSEDGEPDDSAM